MFRRRAKIKVDKHGVVWEHQGTWFKQSLLKEYDRMILAGKMKGLKLIRYKMMNALLPPAAARKGGKARTPRAPAKGCRPLHSCLVATFTSPCVIYYRQA